MPIGALGETAAQGEASPTERKFRGKRYRQMLAGFNVYRTPGLVPDAIALPTLHTTYRGVPFSSESQVANVTGAEVTFEIGGPHLQVVRRSEMSLIASPVHGMTFCAQVKGYDIDDGWATFMQFAERRRGGGAEQRSNLRVEPDEPIEVNVSCLGQTYTGSLVDVSVVSIAIYLPDIPPDRLAEGIPVEVVVPVLGDSSPSLQASGEILRAMPVIGDDAQGSRVVVYLRVNQALYDRLKDYVDQRRSQILKELAG